MARTLLNAVSVTVSLDSKVGLGIQKYSKESLDALRKSHRDSHFFKRGGPNGNLIHSIAITPNSPPLGTSSEEQNLARSPWLLAPLTVEAMARFFTEKQRPILKRRPLRVLSQQPPNILPFHEKLPPWIQRRVVLDFETRTITTSKRDSRVVLICGTRTRNLIEANCEEILSAGIPIVGRYVAKYEPSDDPRIRGRLVLAGRVVGVNGTQLVLEDHGDGPKSLSAVEVFLEPRKENLRWCIDHLLGAKGQSVWNASDESAAKFLTGPGRLDLTKKTFDYLRKQQIEAAPGICLELGPLAGQESGSWIFRTEVIKKPSLVFDPSGTRTDIWNERGIDKNGPYDQRTFTPKALRIAVICQASHEGRTEAFLAKLLDGMPNVTTGYGQSARKPFEKGFIRRFGLEAPRVQIFTASAARADAYLDACRTAVQTATDSAFEWNLAIVQIDQDFRELPGADNPYYSTKAFFLKHRIPVQEVTLETMSFSDKQIVFALNNISLATYAKLGGIPWLLKSQPTVAHELVVGIGSHTHSPSRLSKQERVVGITTVFSSDGRYLLDDRTGAVPYDQYRSALFESLSRSIQTVRQNDNWRSSDAVRLIFHVFKQMADSEAEAVAQLIGTLGLSDVKFAFLHVVEEHPFAAFDTANPGVSTPEGSKGVNAPERGLSIGLGDTEQLLCFVGAREVKQASHGLPQPTILRLHHSSTFRDMTYLTRQAFDFSCHSWRMLSPAPQPITIHYSELIAKLLTGLRQVPNWDPDTMLGPVSRTRWFL